MSNVINNIKERRSIRKYKPEMVPKDVIAKVMEAGLYAANGMGSQSSIIVAVTNPETIRKLAAVNAKIMGQGESFDPFYGAPVVLIVLDPVKSPTAVYDGSAVLQTMMLAAEDMGLGTCWIHRAKEEFEMPEWKEWLASIGVQGDYQGVDHCILGYPDGDHPKAPARKEGRIYWAE